MTTNQLFNKFLSLLKKTGQGTPMFIIERGSYQQQLHELINRKLVTVIRQNYNYLPNDETIVIKGVYNVEQDCIDQGNLKPLLYLRHYLAVDKPLDEVESSDDYKQWKSKNEDMIQRFINMPFLSEAEEQLDNPFELMTDSKWYQEDLTISKCISEIEEKISINEEIIHITNKLIRLTQGDPIHRQSYVKATEDKAQAKDEIEQYQKILSILQSQDQNQIIGSFFK